MTWQLSASCRGTDTNVFFPSGPDAQRVTRQLAAAFCSTCPVRAECAEAGANEYGVWGGRVDGRYKGQLGPGRTHGCRSTYRQGCRCSSCTSAYANSRRKRVA